jgi:hypothetical protein
MAWRRWGGGSSAYEKPWRWSLGPHARGRELEGEDRGVRAGERDVNVGGLPVQLAVRWSLAGIFEMYRNRMR